MLVYACLDPINKSAPDPKQVGGAMSKKQWLTARELSEETGISRRVLYDWANQGVIPVLRSKEGGRMRFNREAVFAALSKTSSYQSSGAVLVGSRQPN